MIVIDIIAVAFVLALATIVSAVAYSKSRAKQLENPKNKILAKSDKLKEQGSLNVVQMQVDSERLCGHCGKFTDATKDLFLDNVWIHRSCYESQGKN